MRRMQPARRSASQPRHARRRFSRTTRSMTPSRRTLSLSRSRSSATRAPGAARSPLRHAPSPGAASASGWRTAPRSASGSTGAPTAATTRRGATSGWRLRTSATSPNCRLPTLAASSPVCWRSTGRWTRHSPPRCSGTGWTWRTGRGWTTRVCWPCATPVGWRPRCASGGLTSRSARSRKFHTVALCCSNGSRALTIGRLMR
mmetsp:Transcript_33257/g.99501  ORF Transcript_33257/g.99501 Transcript_33257/m.99501 type:complete len:202 (-) Transcript_33257:830-1435(-)